MGLKENVIIGKLIPAATGLRALPLARDRAGRARPAARRGPALRGGAAGRPGAGGGDGEGSTLEGFGPSFAEELEELASEIETPSGAEGRVRLGRGRELREVLIRQLPATATAELDRRGRPKLGWSLGAGRRTPGSVRLPARAGPAPDGKRARQGPCVRTDAQPTLGVCSRRSWPDRAGTRLTGAPTRQCRAGGQSGTAVRAAVRSAAPGPRGPLGSRRQRRKPCSSARPSSSVLELGLGADRPPDAARARRRPGSSAPRPGR